MKKVLGTVVVLVVGWLSVGCTAKSEGEATAATTSAFTQEQASQLDGQRVVFLGDVDRGAVYLVDRGTRRHIPDPDTYNSLFRSWDGIYQAIDPDSIPVGAPLTSGAVLMKGESSDTVFLVESGKKRGIPSPAVMDKYDFDWNKIHVVPQIVANSIPDGDIIQ